MWATANHIIDGWTICLWMCEKKSCLRSHSQDCGQLANLAKHIENMLSLLPYKLKCPDDFFFFFNVQHTGTQAGSSFLRSTVVISPSFDTSGRVIFSGPLSHSEGSIASPVSNSSRKKKGKSAGKKKKSVSLQEKICKLRDSNTRSLPEAMPLSHGTNKKLSPLLNHDKGQNITTSPPFISCLHLAKCECF